MIWIIMTPVRCHNVLTFVASSCIYLNKALFRGGGGGGGEGAGGKYVPSLNFKYSCFTF